MADMELVRVIALDEEVTEPEAGQYLLVDTAEGTKKMQVENLLQAAGLSNAVKSALLACFQKVAWVDDHGQDYYDALEAALYASSVGLSAVFTQGDEKYYSFDSLDSLKENLVVTYTNDQGQSSVVTNYTLSGTLTVGTSVITVGYNGLTTRFNVTVSDIELDNGIALTVNTEQETLLNYVVKTDPITARCVLSVPIKNRDYVISVIDSTKYNIAGHNLENNVLTTFSTWTESGVITKQGYLKSDNTAASWGSNFIPDSNYAWCFFKKLDGTDFTADEIENAYGTIFVIGEQSDTVVWNGTDDATYPPKWVDKNHIIGITDPQKLFLVSGYGIKGYIETSGAYPQISAKRATSLSQIIVGDLDGKTIGLSSYELSSGSHIAYGLWYGYLNNGSFDGTQYVSQGTDNVYVFGKWLSENVVLPVDDQKIGSRIALLAFKISDADRDFTQAELREIPTLITIS